MKREFEKHFPLPWHIEEDETGQLRTLCPASGEAFMDFGIVEGPLDFDGYDVQEYLVRCANLMPEAAALIKRWRDEKAKRREELCTSCANDEDGYMDSDECDTCLCKELDADIELADKLLVKLEGGAEDERD